jgi:hypothetical protein
VLKKGQHKEIEGFPTPVLAGIRFKEFFSALCINDKAPLALAINRLS